MRDLFTIHYCLLIDLAQVTKVFRMLVHYLDWCRLRSGYSSIADNTSRLAVRHRFLAQSNILYISG